MKRITVSGRDGQALAAHRFDCAGLPKACVVIAAAMATPQSFYAPFARYLAPPGFTVWRFDDRGTGESLRGSMRGVRAELTDWYQRDYDAVVSLAADAHSGTPVFAVGHRFGGQSAALVPDARLHSQRRSGVVVVGIDVAG